MRGNLFKLVFIVHPAGTFGKLLFQPGFLAPQYGNFLKQAHYSLLKCIKYCHV
jgi:hypothetical protein